MASAKVKACSAAIAAESHHTEHTDAEISADTDTDAVVGGGDTPSASRRIPPPRGAHRPRALFSYGGLGVGWGVLFAPYDGVGAERQRRWGWIVAQKDFLLTGC
ncbi:hypothetical protein ES703_49166 [subsurface metagenome]